MDGEGKTLMRVRPRKSEKEKTRVIAQREKGRGHLIAEEKLSAFSLVNFLVLGRCRVSSPERKWR